MKSVDMTKREVVVDPPHEIGVNWCEGFLPVSRSESIHVAWKLGSEPVVDWLDGRGGF